MPDCDLLHSMTLNSCRDHGASCPSCWATALAGVAAGDFRHDESVALIHRAFEHASTDPEHRPEWRHVKALLLAAFERYASVAAPRNAVQHPEVPALLEALGRAANQS